MKTFSCYGQLLALIGSVFEAYSAVLVLPVGKGGVHRIAAHFSLGEKVDTESVIDPGKGLIGWVIRNEKPMLVNNVDQYQNHLGYYIENEDAFIKAFMACPLGNGRGVLCLDSKRQYSFAEKDQKILHLFARLILDLDDKLSAGSASRELATYYNALQIIYTLRRRFSRWSAFLQHFLQLLSETSGFPYCFFAARDESGQNYFLEGENVKVMMAKNRVLAFPMGAGLVGWMFRNGSPVFESDASRLTHLFGGDVATPVVHSIVCIPLVVHHITRGVLCLTHDSPVAITDELKNFLQMSAEHLALFLENLYLKNKLQVAASSLESLSGSHQTASETFVPTEE